MKITPLVFAMLCLFFACKDDDNISGNDIIPDCIEILISPGTEQDTFLQSVRRMKVQTEYHYWLNNGFIAFDGEEFIVNDQCDTVCYFCGFCQPPPCDSLYDFNSWEIIWEK